MIALFCVVSSFVAVGSVQQVKDFITDKPLEYREYKSVLLGQSRYTLLNIETPDDFVIVATESNGDDFVITTEKEFLRVLGNDKDSKFFVANNALSKGYTELDLFAHDIDFVHDIDNDFLSIERPVVLDFICGSSLQSICLLLEENNNEYDMKNYNSLSGQVSREVSFEAV